VVREAYDDGFARMYTGDAIEVLATLPEKSVHMAVTSPPYFGLRSYLPAGHPDKAREGGTQETPQEYVSWLVEVMRGVWRVLRDDGTVWLNLGDSYAATFTSGGGAQGEKWEQAAAQTVGPQGGKWSPAPKGWKPKDLLMIPARVAIALCDDGWYLRQELIWDKPSCMPESVRDRCTRSHEMLYMLTKKPRYFYDAEAIAESLTTGEKENYPARARVTGRGNQKRDGYFGLAQQDLGGGYPPSPNGKRNARSVWRISPKPYAGSHYATFPPELPEKCIKAGTSERGVCSECGAPYVRVVEKTQEQANGHKGSYFDRGKTGGRDGGDRTQAGERFESRTVGWEPGCACSHDAPVIPATVLDPFSGAGTTLMVARKLGRRGVGIDLDERNVKLLEERLGYQGVLL
jgi:DNA modification methylase